MFKLFLTAFAALALTASQSWACLPPPYHPTSPFERIDQAEHVFVGIFQPTSASRSYHDVTHTVEVAAIFKGKVAKTLRFKNTPSCVFGITHKHRAYLFFESARNVSAASTGQGGYLTAFTQVERFATVEDAVAAAETYFTLAANSRRTAPALEASTSANRRVDLSGPPELLHRIEESFGDAEDGCVPNASRAHAGVYIDRQRGYWIDWGVRDFRRRGAHPLACGNPMGDWFDKPGTYRIRAGLFTPSETREWQIDPQDWEWTGTAEVTIP